MDHFLNGTAIKRFRIVWLVIPYWIAIYGVLLWKSEKNDLRSAIFSDAGSLFRILTLLSHNYMVYVFLPEKGSST